MIMTELSLPIIGIMRSPYVEKFGIPRQPNLVQVESFIEMLAPYNVMEAFEGIEAFSHLWLIWQFHDNKNQQQQDKFRPQVRPPRLGGNKKIGIFATRSMYRPAPVGLSVVQLKQVKKVGNTVRVYVTGSDLLNGTPILDIKPYIQYSDAVLDAQSGYAQDRPIVKQVRWSEHACQSRTGLLQQAKIDQQYIAELESVLALDPRPAYQDDAQRIYGMRFGQMNIKFSCSDEAIVIQEIMLYEQT
ncbi:tRNA (N6-threonylcarbamoyladenosine(37)-N6)-methyltransferase TrmO [Acinetobacter bereziniae]|jgi:tRNA-Thr(GGU) m(6)t(6)A37 methyltransferase TsaA|uniref:tRNA (N6-threonylcarbamoyladenosine(37)-N6)-methyltransferase TrmO n=1 Tax=Acinetobacter bereziniae TaxID=106648 RepID=A0A8I1ACK8_ACIBZ|nr:MULTISPECIES: tRNA (N6-threonylcarbamoyladenosine(37)-N6)-methyltransferase TrmO [Acinetobacter]MEC8125338.1 tRNA (N6-threonylcarbamoyladenosine(37)-N6)-methyltransferase TrmO [Pseudomonadota bacterium]MBJ9947718.1 tRNA (N6-threonylcarbamoyladenosine(37)-N6)-methyltransferase TrmO [Acinetobacter bereziniae]MCM8513394.1 tRNA (N6-threonylcarbamoyladenosine(37)-N6)-methyltransferase TrmO [Acinetobacter bereziniae]MDR3028202.1 tRNA (N6-threonylcarbamoyladenosine(37)-N6)-methyltransferase TrmO [A